MNDDLERCTWPGTDPLYVAYHDEEWGVPEWDDQALFEKLILDGFQAGLSWITILRKRDNFRTAFSGFDPVQIAKFDEQKVKSLMNDAGIVRNQAKIRAAIASAQAWIDLRDHGVSFSEFLWQFTDGKVKHNKFKSLGDLPAKSLESNAISKELKRLGFKFCGPTICYAFMQAVGMVNDHVVTCFRHAEILDLDPNR